MSNCYTINGLMYIFNPYTGIYTLAPNQIPVQIPQNPVPYSSTPQSRTHPYFSTYESKTKINFPELCFQPRGAIESAHKFMLDGKLEFVPYPGTSLVLDRVMPYSPEHGIRLFLGQLPWAMPASVTLWTIDLLLRRTVVKRLNSLKGRPECSFLCLVLPEDRDDLLQYNGGLMFDLNGVWIVSEDPHTRQTQINLLRDYSRAIKAEVVRSDPRLPKNPIVIESPSWHKQEHRPLL